VGDGPIASPLPTILSESVTLRLTVSQSVCLGVEPNYGTFDHRLLFIFFYKCLLYLLR
jgi:hypothetical protein